MKRITLTFKEYVPGDVEDACDNPQHFTWTLGMEIGGAVTNMFTTAKLSCSSDPSGLFHYATFIPVIGERETLMVSKMMAAYWDGYFRTHGFSLHGYSTKSKRGLNISWGSLEGDKISGLVRVVGPVPKGQAISCHVVKSDCTTAFHGIPISQGGVGYLPKFEVFEKALLDACLTSFWQGLRKETVLTIWDCDIPKTNAPKNRLSLTTEAKSCQSQS